MKIFKSMLLGVSLMLAGLNAASATSINIGNCEPGACDPYAYTDKEPTLNLLSGHDHLSFSGLGEADTLTSATVKINYLVNLDLSAYLLHQSNEVYAYSNEASDWAYLGNLKKSLLLTSTSFILDSSWFDEVSSGLQLLIKGGSLASLGLSSLSVTGEYCPPEVSEVPIPAAAFLFAPALLGFMGLRRRKQA